MIVTYVNLGGGLLLASHSQAQFQGTLHLSTARAKSVGRCRALPGGPSQGPGFRQHPRGENIKGPLKRQKKLGDTYDNIRQLNIIE